MKARFHVLVRLIIMPLICTALTCMADTPSGWSISAGWLIPSTASIIKCTISPQRASSLANLVEATAGSVYLHLQISYSCGIYII